MKRQGLLQRAAFALGALLLLAFLAVNLRAVDPAKHDDATGRLAELQALDSELSETVLKLRYGLLGSYDHLAATLQRVSRVKESLETGDSAITGRGDRNIDEAMKQFSASLLAKEVLIERFKSDNALLRNSVFYLPLSVETAATNPLTPPELRKKLHDTLKELLLVQVGAARDNYSRATRAIVALSAARDASPPQVRGIVDKVLLHAEYIVQNHQRMDLLLPRITSADSGRLGAELTLAYNRAFEAHLARSNAYRLALLLASIALLTYAAYAFVCLRTNARALAESESRYRSVVAAIAEGIVVRDAAGRITTCNASAERILGRTLDEIQGGLSIAPGWELIREDGVPVPEEERPFVAALRTATLQSNVVLGFRKPHGTVLWLSMSAQPLFNGRSATPAGVVTSLIDITHRKQAQARLAMEHAITRVLAEADTVSEAMSAIIRILCDTLGFVYGSYWERDGSSDTLRESAMWSIDVRVVKEFAMDSRERGRTLEDGSLMKRVWTSQKSTWIGDLAQEPTFDRPALAARAGIHSAFVFPVEAGGEVFGAIECVSRDAQAPDEFLLQSTPAISSQIAQFIRRKRAEESSRLAANAMRNTAEGIAIYDGERRVVFANDAFTTITGYGAEEVMGKHPTFLRVAGEDAFYAQLWDRVRETGHWQGELKRRRKSGEIYPELRSISAVDNAGQTSHYVAAFTDITRFKDYEARLEFLAHHDVLTNLPNRLLFHDRCNEAFVRGKRHGKLAAVLFVDLDRFKAINDSLGHETGDTLLQAVGTRLRECVRASDTVARAGGDEFTILLDELHGADDAGAVAQKILTALAQPFRLAGHELFISGSIGIACYPADGTDTATLLKNADAAMYRAKEDGRNAYRFFSVDMNAHALETLLLSNSLRLALEREELLLHYQPRIDLATHRITGVEALIRWQRPGVGLVPPGRFIPLAEETGLILPIGEWAIKAACKQLSAWQAAGLPSIRMAVNLSARQLGETDFAQRIAAILAENGVEPSCLELEITESMVMRDPAATVKVLTELSAIGVTLAIDDFGTGYSSLSYLKRFPIDTLKIDQSFVRGIPSDGDDVAITRTIVAMAKSLDLHVVAEGVEKQEQLALLKAAGCKDAQGYFFSKPLPARALEPLLRTGYIESEAAADRGERHLLQA